jgi:long-chain acyl-CoA synthetase
VDLPPDRPWLASYAPGVPFDIEVPDGSLVEILESSVARFPDRIALDFFGATTTYARLGEQVQRAAGALRTLGVSAGDRVAVALPNCPQHVVVFYAALRLGAIVVEHNPLYTREELEHQLADHEPVVAVVWDSIAATVRDVAPTGTTVVAVDLTTALPLRQRVALRLPVRKAREMRAAMHTSVPGVLKWERQLRLAEPLGEGFPRPRAEDIALLQYTGGTTGVPKAAMLTHRNLLANVVQSRSWVPALVDGQETFYAVIPLFHAYGLTLCLTTAVYMGATIVLFPKFDVGQVLDAVGRRPPTFLPGVPPIYPRLARGARERGVSLTSLRFSLSGAMPLPPATVAEWEDVTGGLLVEGYGMTETSPIAVGNPLAPTRRAGTAGIPFPSTEARVVDRNDPLVDMPLDEPGELLIRGPQVFDGYWHRPRDTEAVLLPDGWLRTGDVVVMDEDGFITIVDRIKELILVGGFNVYPSEVEDVLKSMPGVADAAVVGTRSAAGEKVVAAVVAEPGVTLDPGVLREQSRAHLAAYKVPRRVVVVDELPKTAIGKLLRRELRDQLESS